MGIKELFISLKMLNVLVTAFQDVKKKKEKWRIPFKCVETAYLQCTSNYMANEN